MTRRSKFNSFVLAIIALVLIGYGGGYVVSLGLLQHVNSAAGYVAVTLLLMVVVLGAPYVLLKLLGHAAHSKNPKEIIPKLKDLPKTQDQLNKSHENEDRKSAA